MEELARLRTQIDELDAQLLELLGRRLELVRQVGEYKKSNDVPVHDRQREADILQSLREKAKQYTIPEDMIDKIWQTIFREAKHIEEQV